MKGPTTGGIIGFTTALTLACALGAAPSPGSQGEPAGAQAPAATPAARQGGGLQFTEPSPLDFADREGYVSIFDGRTLEGWDGNPKFWRVEAGAIVGESTPERPSKVLR